MPFLAEDTVTEQYKLAAAGPMGGGGAALAPLDPSLQMLREYGFDFLPLFSFSVHFPVRIDLYLVISVPQTCVY